jgi:hypothetical protein
VKGYGTTQKIVHPFQAETLVSENNEAFAKDERMQVEYINNKEGTRQNFIINQPIQGSELAVHLNINTSLTATQENEGSIKFTGKQNSTRLYYNDLKVWDATGKILPAQMKLCNVGPTIRSCISREHCRCRISDHYRPYCNQWHSIKLERHD